MKKILSFLFLGLFTLNTGVAFAMPARQSETISIEAKVLSVQQMTKRIAHADYQTDKNRFNNLAFYEVKLQLKNHSYSPLINKRTTSLTAFLTIDEYNKSKPSAGDRISGEIRFVGDEWFNGWRLENVQILNKKQILGSIRQCSPIALAHGGCQF